MIGRGSLESMFSDGDVDVAIVGAGAAGIAAARRLADAPANFVVLEARPRIGGRAWTTERAGFPLDFGCGWLHSADRNPWTRIFEAAGFAIDRTPAPWTSDDRDLSFREGEFAEYRAAVAEFYARLDQVAADEQDRAAAEFLVPSCRWNALINAVSTYANGAELDRISISDVTGYADTGINWRVREGYGTAIAAYGSGLPVALDCAVRRIDRGGRVLRLETDKGAVTARRAIVTVPTSLLASEAIRFDPPLPEKLEAAAGLPLGLANKVVLAVERPEALPVEVRLFGKTDRTGTGSYHLRPFSLPLIEGYFGGRLAGELERDGEEAAFDFATGELAAHFGNDFRKLLRPVAVTVWGHDPYAEGSYSYALPGKAAARALLALPVDDRLFFAGEACSTDSFSTAHGAYETGKAAAEAVLATLAHSHARAG